ncbi:MAG TPA: hypothetical protein VH741_09315, partial [Candidatus Limnocylindrales bacterium]
MIRPSLLRTACGLGAAAIVASALIATAPPGGAQQGPIQLFPERAAPSEVEPVPEPAPPRLPAPSGPPVLPPAEPEGRLVVEGLAAPGLDAIGLSGPAEGGFGRALWQGSDAQLVGQLLADLPVVTRVPPLRRLAQRLLVSPAPVGGQDPGDLLALRIERLVAMGDLDHARALVERVPPLAADSVLARRAAEVHLLSGDEAAACRLADSLAPTSGAEFWAEIAVFCRLVEDDREGARLGIDLMREAGQTGDRAFFALASAMVNQTDPPASADLAELTPVHLALLARAKWPLPPDALTRAGPPALAAVAREPALAGGRPLAALEQAFFVGATSADRVAAAYAEQTPGAGGDPLWAANHWDAGARAAAYAAVRAQSDPAARAALLDAAWQGASGAERFLVAEVFAQPFTELPVERELAGVAPSVARALLAAERPVPAVGWLSLLTADAGTGADDAVAGLVPLFALAGAGGSAAVPRMDGEAMQAWRDAVSADPAMAERLFALLEGAGAPVAAGAWAALLAGRYQRQQAAPATVLWRGLEQAA